MTQVHWLSPINGSFTNASDWSGGVVPGASDDAILDAAGVTIYTVTASTSETVNSIQTAANATLAITGGDFTATAGTGGGENAGSIVVGYGDNLAVGGTIDNVAPLLSWVRVTAFRSPLLRWAAAASPSSAGAM